MKVVQSFGVSILVVALGVVPAFADSVHIGGTTNITNEGGQGGAGGNAAAAASATSNPVQVNTQVTTQGQQQGQAQNQGQQQGQIQGQGQGQKQQANNEGNHQDTRIDVPRQAPPAVPSGLAVSSLTCYGSWSIAASTPFGGVGAGFPTKDADCERSRNAALLNAFGYQAAALALMAQNEDTAKALKAAGVKVPGQVAKAEDTKIPDLKLNTPLGEEPKAGEKKSEPSNFGTRSSLPSVPVVALVVQGQ